MQRILPVALVVPDGFGGSVPLWFGEHGSELVERRPTATVRVFFRGLPEGLSGATHVVELHGEVDIFRGAPIMDVWRHATAAELRTTRQLDEALAQRGETREPEPGFDYTVGGVVRSNTGGYHGTVHVRASPVERNAEGAATLRHQWITVEWEQGTGGEWTAAFELDRLDGAPYRVVVLSVDGKDVDGAPIMVDAIGPPDSLVFTVLD